MKYDNRININNNSASSLILRRINPGSHILEFGPATGYMTRYMKEELGCTISCIEIDRQAAKLAEKYCERMIIADIDDLDWEKKFLENSFDHIIFADVLEHLRDPWAALVNSVPYLKKDGTMLTSIPNIGHNAIIMELFQGRFDYQQLGLLDITHLRFFTRKGILDLLEKADLCPVEWLAVINVPECTEFQQNYESFPDTIQRYLRKRDDAHIYQFVTVSKKKLDVKPEECCKELNIKDDSVSQIFFLQVFWSKNLYFDETQSVKVPITENNDFQRFNIKLPKGIVQNLRFDPVAYPAHIEIKSIDLYVGDVEEISVKEPVFSWSKYNSFVDLSPGPGVIKLDDPGFYSLISTDHDPQLLLTNIPSLDSEQSKIISILMRFDRDLTGIYSKEFSKIQANLIEKEEQLLIIQKRLEEVNTTLINNEKVIKNQSGEIESLMIKMTNYEESIKSQEESIKRLSMQLVFIDENLQNKKMQLDSILNSTSWRLTKPIRCFKNFLNKFAEKA